MPELGNEMMTTGANPNSTSIIHSTYGFVVENFLFGDKQEIDEEQSFIQSGVIDSTGILELVQYLEETYGFTIDDEEMVPENLDSLSGVASFVQRKLGS